MITRRQFSAVAGASLLAAAGIGRAQQSGKIILGQSAALTGAAAQLGIQFQQGAKLWFDQFNAQGGVGGRLIEVRTLDDGYETDRCVANTRKFLEEDVFAMFGYIGTPTSQAALPLVNKAQVPFIAPFTGAKILRDPGQRNVFHLRASYNDEIDVIVKQLTNLGLKKIGVFYQNDAYGQSGLEGVTQSLAARELKPVAQATVERNSTNVDAAVKTLLAAAPDAIIQVSVYKSCAAFIRSARKAGYGGTFYNLSGVGTQALIDELGKEATGVVVTQVVPSPYSSTRPIAREFAEAVKKTNGAMQSNFSSMEGYLAAKLVTEGLKRAGGKAATREGLIAGIESIGRQSFGGFDVHVSPTLHVASQFVELSMLTGDGRVRT
jgi:ABC-type branched-subunit amino acid transport system substrate-binding protein